MKNAAVATICLATCLLFCGFQQGNSSAQRKPEPRVGSTNEQKADNGKGPHGNASPSQPATDATDKNAIRPTAPRQNDKVEVTALPPEIAVKQVKDSIDRTIMWCTIILTLVGVAGTVAALKTLRQVKRQANTLDEHRVSLEQLAKAAQENAAAANKNAEATENAAAASKASADATLLNAQAFINAERPWLLIAPVGFRLDVSPLNRLDWRVTNQGRTVANVVEVKLRCTKCRGMEKILTLPPAYGSVINFYDTPIPPSGSLDAWSYIETEESKSNGLTTRDVEDIQSRGDDLAAYCSVTYRDQFGRLHESRFCYYYAVAFSEFRINLRAPAEYHRGT